MLYSFDGTTTVATQVLRPDRYRDLKKAVSEYPKVSLLGAGLSYTMAFGASTHPSIDLRRFNRLLSFDATKGILKLESGATLGDTLEFSIHRGWNISVLPGHPSITIGGCVAFNVHGKSQFSSGNFENIVIALTLFHPDHGEVNCSREERADIFWLTIGGMGLTGIILDVTIQLAPLKGALVERTSIPSNNLLHAAEQMRELEHDYDYLYSWNNLCRRGGKFGRGVIFAERFIGDSTKPQYGEFFTKLTDVKRRPHISIFSKGSAPAINLVFETKERMFAGTRQLPIGPATFPIAGKEFYFSLLGHQGFIEYQCIFPKASIASSLRLLEELVTKFDIRPSLGSLKNFKGRTRDLCFQQDGVCIAIDIPVAGHQSIQKFLSQLDTLVIDHGGIANLAKDSRLGREVLAKMYPGYGYFWEKLRAWDPKAQFSSELRCRIEPL